MARTESRPGFIERLSLTSRRLAGLGFIALAGASIVMPAFIEGAVDFGLIWAGSDLVYNSSKNHRLESEN